MKILTFSPTVFLIFAPASLTVFPALFTALYKKLPIVFAPWRALVDTINIKYILFNEQVKKEIKKIINISCS